MLSEHHLLGNLQALAGAGTPAPPLGRVDPEALRLVEHDGDLSLAIRGADGRWVVLGDGTGALPTIDRRAPTVCLVGTRAGRAIDAVGASHPDSRIVAIEPDPAHALVLLSRRDWREPIRSGRLTILIGPDYPGASTSARRLDVTTPPPVVTDPLLAEHRSTATTAAAAVLARMFAEARANEDARRAFAPRYLEQTLQNLPAIAREGNVAALDNHFAGTPAVIVGAGPSLDENAADLKRLHSRALVIASDTALAPLETAGIDVPLVVAVDPSEWNARHLAAPRRVDGTYFVAEGSLHPSVFERFAGRTFVFEVSGHEPWAWLKPYGITRGRLRAWGSVVTSAFDLALRMGCDPIVFVGLDLAFTKGQTYCRHTAHEAVWGKWIEAGDTWENVWSFLVSQQPRQTLADRHGAPAVTTPFLMAFRNWLVDEIGAAPQPRRFINATGAGLLHGPRIEQLSLDLALGDRPAISRAAIARRLSTAHQASTSARAPFDRAIREALAQLTGSASSPLEDRWRRFSAGAFDRARLSGILAAAAETRHHD
jgi:hypothetical protein